MEYLSIPHFGVYKYTTFCSMVYLYRGDSMYRRIRDLREDNDYTQKDVAKFLNCSQQAYSKYELGQRDIPTEILIALAKFYNTTSDYILELSDERNKK